MDANEPPYVDDFGLAPTSVLDDNEKFCLLTQRWDAVHNFVFPSRYIAKGNRKMQTHWFVNNSWLRYSKSANGVYCAPCVLFSGKKEGLTFASTPATDPSNIKRLIDSHADNKYHLQSMEAADNYVAVMKGEKKDILQMVSSSYNTLVEKNRNILVSIVDELILCGKQNIAIRGHEDKDSNFVALLEYQSKYNPVLNDHLQNGDPRSKYISPRIQNELIDICGGIIREEIVRKCNDSPYFGFIADKATDAATMEQMSMSLRFFDVEKKELREDFLVFFGV